MRPDIVNLRQFYSSALGRKVKRQLRRVLRECWCDEKGLHTVGVGYSAPLLTLASQVEDPVARVIALMPHAQGAIYWPVHTMNHSVLGDELCPPFTPSSLHRVIVAHAFEHLVAPDEFLRIWWQLLVPGGRMILLVPNRRGLWARFGATPFTSGTPYRIAAIKTLANDAGFTLREMRSVLFSPPSTHPVWLKLFSAVEWLMSRMIPRMGGVLVVEIEKQIYAGVRVTPSNVKLKPQWQTATSSFGASRVP